MSDVNIIRINPDTRVVDYAFNLFPRKVSGIEAALQLAAKTILTTPGTDIFASDYGGGLLSYAGKNLLANNIARIKADIAYIIDDSKRQIQEEQAIKHIAMSERIKDLTLLGIYFNKEQSGLDIFVTVTVMSGETSDLLLSTQIRKK